LPLHIVRRSAFRTNADAVGTRVLRGIGEGVRRPIGLEHGHHSAYRVFTANWYSLFQKSPAVAT
jgi:hypothetical protein